MSDVPTHENPKAPPSDRSGPSGVSGESGERAPGQLPRGPRLRVGLTGGIGSGKSTVAALLAAKGAVVVDADALAREVVGPGTPGLAAVLAAFGDGVRAPDGSLDRAALASVVFADEGARARLNALVHPLVGQRTAELLAAAPEGCIWVHDVALLVESGLAPAYDVVVVVSAPAELAVQRLVALRGMSDSDARARIAAQADDAARRAVATHVIDNAGDLSDLARQVDAVWEDLLRRSA